MTRRPAQRIAFDVNGLVALCRDDALGRAARLKARKHVRLGQLVVVAGFPLLAELAGLSATKPEIFRRQMRELERLCKGRVLRRWIDRVLPEVRQRGRLPDRDAFLPARRAKLHFSDPKAAFHLDSEASQLKGSFENMVKSELSSFRASLDDPRNLRIVAKEFRDDPDEYIDRWCIEHAYGIVGAHLKADHGAWPRPNQIPSLTSGRCVSHGAGIPRDSGGGGQSQRGW